MSKTVLTLFCIGLLFVVLGFLLQKVPSPGASVSSVLISQNIPSKTIQELNSAHVKQVIDGDTVDVVLQSGRRERIRLLGINAPETVDPDKPVECFGREASLFAKQMLEKRTILLEADLSQGDKDMYKRLLRYVFLPDGTNVDLQMIREGFAREYTFHTPYRYRQEFLQVQEEAKAAKKGLWGAC